MVEYTQESPGTVFFSWDSPPVSERNGVIVSYIIACSLFGFGGLQRDLISISTSVSFDMLRPSSMYNCTFLAVTSAGNGPTAELNLLTCECMVLCSKSYYFSHSIQCQASHS